EIIDAYCKILILARQLGRVNYFSDQQTGELLDLKKRLGYDDVRFRKKDVCMCGPSSFDDEYDDFVPEPFAFRRTDAACPSVNGRAASAAPDTDELVRLITDQVMAALAGAAV